MSPAEQYQLCNQRDTGAMADLLKPERAAPILGSIGGLLMAVNSKDGILKTAGVVLTVGSLYYGIATKPAIPEISSNP